MFCADADMPSPLFHFHFHSYMKISGYSSMLILHKKNEKEQCKKMEEEALDILH